MKKYLRWRWLFYTAMIIVGGNLLIMGASRWMNNRRVYTALSAETIKVLENGEQFTFYSLIPTIDSMEYVEKGSKKKTIFHDFAIRGQSQIKQPEARRAILDALYTGLGKGELTSCFNPRHGIRVVQGNKTVDLVICFECQHLYIHDEHGKRLVPIIRFSQRALDQALADSNELREKLK